MKNLPAEILNVIFKSLHQHDKVECMLVCRRWLGVIKQHCLFHTVQFTDVKDYKYFMTYSNQSLRAQTERFVSYIDLKEDLDFSSLFPNLRMLFLQLPYPQLHESPQNLQLQHHHHQQQQHIQFLEQTYENSSCFFTSEVLLRGLCSKLTRITVSANPESTSATPFLLLLKHAPNLKHLSMTSFQLCFMNDFEILHQNAPVLETVEFLFSNVENEVIQVLDITPALTVTAFRIIIRNTNFPTGADLLDYMLKKYPNLVEFDASNFLRKLTISDVEKRFSQLLYGLNLQTLSTQMTKAPLDLFKLLDGANCQIETIDISADRNSLDVWKELAHSNQVNSIHTLTLHGIPIHEDFYRVLLKELKVLKRLTLHPKNETVVKREKRRIYFDKRLQTISMDSIFCYCSSKVLELLSFSRCILQVYANASCLTLTHLNLSYVTLQGELDKYISESLPNLRYLILTHCELIGKEFCLPNHRLFTLEITEAVNPKLSRLLVINEKAERLWIVPQRRFHQYKFMKQHFGNDNSISPYFLRIANDAINMVPDIIFECKSVDNIMYLVF